MKNQKLISTLAVTSLTIDLYIVNPAYADNFAGNLNAAANATDVYGLTCPIGTVSARTFVDDGGAADGLEVSVQLINPHGLATTATAPDGGAFSAQVGLGNNAGQYLVSVHKDFAGAQNYIVNLDCYNGGGMSFAGFQSVLIQDQ